MSAGCHVLLREGTSVCVTSPAEVIEEVGRIGDDLAPRPEGEVRTRDALGPVLRGVLEAVPSVRPVGPAVLASRAGLEVTQLLRSVGELVVAGFVELTDEGYRLSSAERKAVRARREAMKAAAAQAQASLDHGDLGGLGDLGDVGDVGELGHVGELGELGHVGELGELGHVGELGELGDCAAPEGGVGVDGVPGAGVPVQDTQADGR
jgi:hypothetical protein